MMGCAVKNVDVDLVILSHVARILLNVWVAIGGTAVFAQLKNVNGRIFAESRAMGVIGW